MDPQPRLQPLRLRDKGQTALLLAVHPPLLFQFRAFLDHRLQSRQYLLLAQPLRIPRQSPPTHLLSLPFHPRSLINLINYLFHLPLPTLFRPTLPKPFSSPCRLPHQSTLLRYYLHIG